MSLRVGTSGWSYQDWRRAFYPKGEAAPRWLEFYATQFGTVEVNATFYRLPAEATLRSWHDTVPDDFVFAVKASRYLTHVRRLRDPRGPVETFLDRTAVLGAKRGPILLQLPPDMTVELDRLDETLTAFGSACRVAVEVRHPSWDRPETHQLLADHDAALCLADRRGPLRPMWATAKWGYVRFHAGRAHPDPSYGRRALATWVERIGERWPASAEVWAYFNNDHLACAPANARSLISLAERRSTPAGSALGAGGA